MISLRRLLFTAVVLFVSPAAAQEPAAAPALLPMPAIGAVADDRLRIDQLLGRASTTGYLLRSSSRLLPSATSERGSRLQIHALQPRLVSVWNSALPHTFNDGALWAGRGTSLALTAGARADFGPVSLVVAPEIRYEQNRTFDIVYHPQADRSRFAHRWHWAAMPLSIDMPMRFGDEARAFLGPGQSSLTVDAGPVLLGWATDDQWWGPGLRNAIVMSDHAAGIPRAFVGSDAPVATAIGDFEYRWISGRLKESVYFDSIPRNDLRHLSGWVFSYSPSAEPGLTLGAARAVVGRMSGNDDYLERMLAPFLNKDGRDEQVASLFFRWVFPRAGFETYAEWARHDLPGSIRDFLVNPNHTQGYTVGVQWARPVSADSSRLLRLQSEITYLEQSTTTRHRPTGSFYTSDRVLQGFTHRGQVIGASIGPGSSSQWIAADYLGPAWQLGLFGSRIRWDNDAYYLTQEPSPLDHDVTVLGGLRGAARLLGTWVELELTTALRYNFMFQNSSRELGAPGDWDIRNHTVRIGFSPPFLRSPEPVPERTVRTIPLPVIPPVRQAGSAPPD